MPPNRNKWNPWPLIGCGAALAAWGLIAAFVQGVRVIAEWVR